MPFVKKNNEDFVIKNDQIFLNKDYLEKNKKLFKKITGTRFSSILNLSHYVSPFKTWTIMVNIFKDVMDPTLVKVGNAVEPKVREYVEQQLGCKYLCYDPFAIKWDVFKENKYFGGIPDGEPLNEHQRIDYSQFPMLEIKTSSIDSFVYKKVNNALQMQKDDNGYPLIKEKGQKMRSWFNNNNQIQIPVEYQYQLGLYLYLRNINKGLFAITFLRPEDYVHPENYNANDHEIFMVNVDVIDKQEIAKQVRFAEEWYKKYIETGISPKMDANDKLWLASELGTKF